MSATIFLNFPLLNIHTSTCCTAVICQFKVASIRDECDYTGKGCGFRSKAGCLEEQPIQTGIELDANALTLILRIIFRLSFRTWIETLINSSCPYADLSSEARRHTRPSVQRNGLSTDPSGPCESVGMDILCPKTWREWKKYVLLIVYDFLLRLSNDLPCQCVTLIRRLHCCNLVVSCVASHRHSLRICLLISVPLVIDVSVMISIICVDLAPRLVAPLFPTWFCEWPARPIVPLIVDWICLPLDPLNDWWRKTGKMFVFLGGNTIWFSYAIAY